MPARAPRRRKARREAVVAVNAQDLLDEVVLDRDVGAPRGDGHGDALLALLSEDEPQARERFGGEIERDLVRPREEFQAREAQGGAPRLPGRAARVDPPRGEGAAGRRKQDLRGAVEGLRDRLRIGPALESVGRVGVKAQPPRGAPDGGRIPPRRFEENVLRGRGHGRVEAAHDAGERDRALGVGHDDVGRVERPLDPVERDELLAAARLAHNDSAAGELVEVERVQRLAGFPEDVVRRVHRGAD